MKRKAKRYSRNLQKQILFVEKKNWKEIELNFRMVIHKIS